MLGHPCRDRHALIAPAAGGVAVQAGGPAKVHGLPIEGGQSGIEFFKGHCAHPFVEVSIVACNPLKVQKKLNTHCI
jgi:hypothetical protein